VPLLFKRTLPIFQEYSLTVSFDSLMDSFNQARSCSKGYRLFALKKIRDSFI
jgi:hypothetical protein